MLGRIWAMKKQDMTRVLRDFEERSPVMDVLAVMDGGDEFRAIVRFDTETLVKDERGEIVTRGPVVVGIRYHERFVAEPPMSAEVVTILDPHPCFHPNVGPSGAICLGFPPANLSMADILHMTWAALVLNMRLVSTVEWNGFNPEAAAYVRANAAKYPLTPRGLLERADGKDKR